MDNSQPILLSALSIQPKRPPLLSAMYSQMIEIPNSSEILRDICNICLPEETEIICASEEPLATFLARFQEEYFPLDEFYIDFLDTNDEEYEGLEQLEAGIPYGLLGVSYDQLHQLHTDHRPAIVATAILCDLRDHHQLVVSDNELRLLWAQDLVENNTISMETANAIPEEGFPYDTIKAALTGTTYQDSLTNIEILMSRTGNFFLDDAMDEERYSGFGDDWTMQNILEAKTKWGLAKELLDRTQVHMNWIESDLDTHIRQMIKLITETAQKAARTL